MLESYLDSNRLLAIARGMDTAQLLTAAQALYRGGCRYLEVSMVTEDAAEQIAELTRAMAGTDMVLGAGTVLTCEDARRAAGAGARFTVSPHTDPELIRFTLELGLFPVPGVATPTDIVTAERAGARLLKLFPAGALGADYVKQLRGPFPRARLVAVGGVTYDNAAALMRAGCVGLGIGGSLFSDLSLVEEKTRKFIKICEENR